MRHPTRPGVAMVVLILVSSGAAACSGSTPVDPATARRERVEARFRSTFSATQTRCILRDLGPSDLKALDRRNTLSGDSDVLKRYSAALSACVASPPSSPNSTPSSNTTTSSNTGATTTASTGTSSGG